MPAARASFNKMMSFLCVDMFVCISSHCLCIQRTARCADAAGDRTQRLHKTQKHTCCSITDGFWLAAPASPRELYLPFFFPPLPFFLPFFFPSTAAS